MSLMLLKLTVENTNYRYQASPLNVMHASKLRPTTEQATESIMRATIAFLFTLLAASQASAQFALDLTPAELRKKAEVVALADLAVEEIGLVSIPRFCAVDDVLYLDDATALEKAPTDYGVNYRVQRKQGGKVTIEASAGAKEKPLTQSLARALRLALQTKCDVLGIGPDRRLQILTINGAVSARALLSSTE